jgi:hypothetical protein
MAGQIFYYETLTTAQIAELDRKHTLAPMVLSPFSTPILWDLRFIEPS